MLRFARETSVSIEADTRVQNIPVDTVEDASSRGDTVLAPLHFSHSRSVNRIRSTVREEDASNEVDAGAEGILVPHASNLGLESAWLLRVPKIRGNLYYYTTKPPEVLVNPDGFVKILPDLA